ncbi:MAG TPA: MEDS domain-containing protein [Gaiellaceae bacterium]|nr:MEDS domain-containing protein [Gaiellaceae bacterium]
MKAAWSGFLHGAGPAGHAVQVYRDVGELADSVSKYLAVGFDLGEPAVVIATPEHSGYFEERLAESGWDRARIERHGLLFRADADTTLAAIIDGDRVLAERFDTVVGGLLDQAAAQFPGRRIRAFGEIVDLLCQRGNPAGAAELEELWNRLARRRSFSLLCGYRVDVFDRHAQVSLLPSICRSHSHVLPADDPARLESAVDAALEEALGDKAGQVYALLGAEPRRKHVPLSQLALMWVSSHMPRSAEQILASAKAHYLQEPARQTG